MTTSVTVRTVDELEKSALNTYRAGLIRRGVSSPIATRAIAKGTPIQLQFRAYAEMMGQVYANERAIEDAQMADSAVGEDLDRLADVHGLARLLGSGAAGDIVVTCSGPTTYGAGQELVAAKGGKRYRVVVASTVSNGGSVGVIGVDVGKATNLAAGEVLTWVSPPGASAPTCVVGIAGLTNGQEADNDARLRERLLKRLRVPPGAGNWADVQGWTERASAGVEAAYVYPALHGPGTVHTAITVEGTADNLYARAAPTALVDVVRAEVLARHPQPANIFVSTVAEAAALVSIKLGLPEPVSAGGPGGGWLDATRWPTGPASVTAVLTASKFTTSAFTGPAVGQRVAFWDVASKKFLHAKILAFSGSSAAYTITVDQAFPSISVGAYLSPDAERIDDYGRLMCEQFALLTPGQRTFGTGRSQRHPVISSDDPAAISSVLVAPLMQAFTELSSASIVHLNGSSVGDPKLLPTAVTPIDTPPNIWVLSQIGFYFS